MSEEWERIKAQYEAEGTVVIQGKEIGDNGRFKDMLRYVPFPEDLTGKRVIDIGCAGGWWSYLAEERGAAEVVAVDANPTMLKIAEANRPEGSKVKFVQGDVHKLRLGAPPLDRPFDVAFFMAVLHYSHDPELAVKNVASLLAPDGECLVETYVKEHAKPGPDIYSYQPSSQQLSMLLRKYFSEISPFSYRPGGTPQFQRAALWARKRAGVFVLITGASGSGKTYLATALAERNPDWRVLRPDIEMGLDQSGDAQETEREQRWGQDFAAYFAEQVPAAIRKGNRVIVAEAVIPDPNARARLLSYIPPDWRKVVVLLDLLPDELRVFDPYWEHPVWQENYPVFQGAAPRRRTNKEPYDTMINFGPRDFLYAVRLIEDVVREAIGGQSEREADQS